MCRYVDNIYPCDDTHNDFYLPPVWRVELETKISQSQDTGSLKTRPSHVIFASAMQFLIYLLWVNACLA